MKAVEAVPVLIAMMQHASITDLCEKGGRQSVGVPIGVRPGVRTAGYASSARSIPFRPRLVLRLLVRTVGYASSARNILSLLWLVVCD